MTHEISTEARGRARAGTGARESLTGRARPASGARAASGARGALVGLFAAFTTLVACGTDGADDGGILGEMHTVQVWFTRGEQPVPAQRRVAGAPLDGAVRALVLGPTPEEYDDGLRSWFSEETRGVIRRVQVSEGHVILDFRDLPDLIPNASTSAGSQQLLTALDSTVFQFDWVRTAEYRLEGSCDAFWEWLQRECAMVERDAPVPPGDVDPDAGAEPGTDGESVEGAEPGGEPVGSR